MSELVALITLLVLAGVSIDRLSAWRERERMSRWYQRDRLRARIFLLGGDIKPPKDRELFD